MAEEPFFQGVNVLGHPVTIPLSAIKDAVTPASLPADPPRIARPDRRREYTCVTCDEALASGPCRCRWTVRCACGFGRDMTEETAAQALDRASQIHQGPGAHALTVQPIA